jgi:hypothetical protein
MIMRRIAQISVMLALALFSYLMIRLTLQYRVMQADVGFLHVKQHAYPIRYWRISFYMHVFTGWLVLIAGFTQFNPGLLRRRPAIHRIMGWTYVMVVMVVSGPAAFVMALYANGGRAGRISFTLLATLWLTFTFLAGYFAVRKRFALHRAYMFLSYALTLSAITFRAYTWLAHTINLPISPRNFYTLDAWLSWVPNLVVAFILIRRRQRVNAPSGRPPFQISHPQQSEMFQAVGHSDA